MNWPRPVLLFWLLKVSLVSAKFSTRFKISQFCVLRNGRNAKDNKDTNGNPGLGTQITLVRTRLTRWQEKSKWLDSHGEDTQGI